MIYLVDVLYKLKKKLQGGKTLPLLFPVFPVLNHSSEDLHLTTSRKHLSRGIRSYTTELFFKVLMYIFS